MFVNYLLIFIFYINYNPWSIDIQPPVMADCPSDIAVFSKEPTVFVNWTTPSFHDPLGTNIQVTTNYPAGSGTFPWGDFIAQYVALKPSNGLRTECTFNITIRRKVLHIV